MRNSLSPHCWMSKQRSTPFSVFELAILMSKIGNPRKVRAIWIEDLERSGPARITKHHWNKHEKPTHPFRRRGLWSKAEGPTVLSYGASLTNGPGASSQNERDHNEKHETFEEQNVGDLQSEEGVAQLVGINGRVVRGRGSLDAQSSRVASLASLNETGTRITKNTIEIWLQDVYSGHTKSQGLTLERPGS